jgi:CHAT domain-containing protein
VCAAPLGPVWKRIFVSVVVFFNSASLLAQDEAPEAARHVLAPELKTALDSAPPATDDKQELSIYFHRRGIAHRRLGNSAQAAEDLKRALEHNQPDRLAPAGWGDRWRIQNDLKAAYEERGDHFAAIALLESVAREWAGRNEYRHYYARLFTTIPYRSLGMWAEADRAYQQATELIPVLRQTRNWSGYHEFNVRDLHAAWRAIHLYTMGQYREAEQMLRAALRDAEQYLRVVSNAERPGSQNIRIASDNVTGRKRWLSSALSAQGKFGEAELLARVALEETLARYGLGTARAAWALGVMAWAAFQQGRLADAERFGALAVTAEEKSGALAHSTSLAQRRGTLGMTYAVQGKWREALEIFAKRDAALRSSEEQFKRHGSDHVDWALALHRAGESQRAASMLERLIAQQRKRPILNRLYVAQLQGYRALVLADLGHEQEALALFREALPVLTEPDSDDREAEDVGFLRSYRLRLIVESYLDLLTRVQTAGRAPAGLDVAAESFAIADFARGSIVQQAVVASAARAQLPDAKLAQLARREQDLLNRIIALNQVLGRLSAASGPQRLDKVIADMQRDIAALRKEHGTLKEQLARDYPDYAGLVFPRPVSLAEMRTTLRDGEAIAALYLGEERSYVWTVTRSAASFRPVSARRSDIEADVAALRRSLDLSAGALRPFDAARAHKLYALFLGPDEHLWRGAKLLSVIPHGALGQLPPSVLLTSAAEGADYAEMPWLARQVALAQLPSASALVALRRTRTGRPERLPFIGFGDPVFSDSTGDGRARGITLRNLTVARKADALENVLPMAAAAPEKRVRVAAPKDSAGALPAAAASPQLGQAFSLLGALPDTAGELREIARALRAEADRDVFVRARASESNVKREVLENRRVVAFATHGLVPGEIPGLDQPALALSNPALSNESGEDGFLTLEEVLALKLDADWVVLSACNTAAADGRGSEAISGLGRAFFYAGARSLLVSNWAVETTSASRLTTGLFRRQAEQPGLSRAEALRQSMLNVMRGTSSDLAGKPGISYAHPAFWAPFTLVGDGSE